MYLKVLYMYVLCVKKWFRDHVTAVTQLQQYPDLIIECYTGYKS